MTSPPKINGTPTAYSIEQNEKNREKRKADLAEETVHLSLSLAFISSSKDS